MSIDVGSKIDVTSKLDRGQARKVLSRVLNGEPNLISFSRHARKQMKKRNLKTGDVLNILHKGRIYNDPEFEHGSWRYQIQTNNITVVIVFRTANYITVVTAWRNK